MKRHVVIGGVDVVVSATRCCTTPLIAQKSDEFAGFVVACCDLLQFFPVLGVHLEVVRVVSGEIKQRDVSCMPKVFVDAAVPIE